MRYPLLTALLILSASLRADIEVSKPLVEAGLAGGLGYIPDYPAAEQGQLRYLLFPVFHLRGKVLRSDNEDGSHARLFKNALFALELSAAGSFPASSDENRARAGMDDLEWLGELGPRAFADLYSDGSESLRASFAVRGAFSTNFATGHFRGVTFSPGLAYDHRRFGMEFLTLSTRLSPQWASSEFQEYFYDVPGRDILPGREAYHSKAGYIGTSLTSGVWYEPGAYGLFAGLSVSFHDQAANTGSPLFRERVTYAGFAGFRWYFFKSNALGYL